MGSSFDWIVEHETLPPDDGRESPPGGQEERRFPWWAWPTIIVLTVAVGLVSLLWILGGEPDPLPQPALEQIEAAARLEVNALRDRDVEILEQVARRRGPADPPLEPPVKAWLAASAAGGRAGDIQLVETEQLAPDLARVQIELVWDEIPYHLNWFYAPTDDRWTRTAAPSKVTDSAQQVHSTHIALTYHESLPGGDSRFMGQLEALIIRYCDLLPCPDGPFQVRLWQEPTLTGYGISKAGRLNYLFPLLGPLRWPAGGGFEPVLLGSFARHLVYDLYVQPRLDDLASANRGALALANYWLAHRLLGLDALPGARWLEEAAQRDGTQAALAFIESLAEDVPPQAAVEAAFRPATVAAVAQGADYFSWLVAQGREVSPSDFDRAVDPWAADGRIYGDLLPEVDRVHHGEGWVMAVPAADGSSTGVYFFEWQDGEWVPSEPPPDDEFALLDTFFPRVPPDSSADQAFRVVTWTGVPTITARWEELPTGAIPVQGQAMGEFERRWRAWVIDLRPGR